MYIADSQNHRIIKTDLSGKLSHIIHSSDVPGDLFRNPGGITIDTKGTVYVTNQGYGRIER